MDNDTVHQSQFAYLDGCDTPLLSRLSYSASEPFTIALAFRVEPGEWVEWEFARDLLIAGLSEVAGIGDVRIRPDLSGNRDLLVLELESPDGYAVVELSRVDVLRFIGRTVELVGLGVESDHLDLDGLIADLTTARP
ncbi:sporulation and cell division protein, SsgA [Saccharomonospora marina XMU15]|uniref:Sporulation and cell division protein, SsgA n=1 Tax=Saccharomonospora marina XMU15 TaxID=882083 RepID=H5X2A0_9PSEU|nr:SsgA family sporulation/cell division regulator [Saccharomonospora marina]EHR48696.1 sporulation and cell division protein, SsgA [Saccharomonospora marina XMU15]